MSFGNMADAFGALREIAESTGNLIVLRSWAEGLALMMGEQENLSAAWAETVNALDRGEVVEVERTGGDWAEV